MATSFSLRMSPVVMSTDLHHDESHQPAAEQQQDPHAPEEHRRRAQRHNHSTSFATFLSPALVGRTSAAESPCAVGRLAPFLPVSHLDVPDHS